MEEKIKGKVGRDRPWTPFMKQIIENIGKPNYKKLKIEVVIETSGGPPTIELI